MAEKKWNAKDYTQNFSFVHEYGESVLDLLDIQPGQAVLDLGCGNGALTKKLSDLGADVVGMDASEEMLQEARKQYPNLDFRRSDATAFHLEKTVDAVFSNAVFHWISDQDALLNCVAGALKPGGQLVCEFGGHGCVETIHNALRQVFRKRGREYSMGFYFPTIGEYAPLLEKHGFRVACATLFDRKTRLLGNDGMKNWIRMFTIQSFQGIPEEEIHEIIAEAVEILRPALYQDGVWYADYVRIRVKAILTGSRARYAAKKQGGTVRPVQ